MKKVNPFYSKCYSVYKSLPLISLILTLFSGFVFGILDAISGITALGYRYDGLAIFFWLLIAVIPAILSNLAVCILISPVIVRTDATLAFLDAMQSSNKQAPKSGYNPGYKPGYNANYNSDLPEI